MVTETESVNALRRRLLDRAKSLENEAKEIYEMARVLADAPKIVDMAKKGAAVAEEEPADKKPVRYNMDLSKRVQDYLAGLPFDAVVNRKDMINTLKTEYGVRGKNESLYAYISSVLKKIADKKDNPLNLRYKKDVGFYRARDGQDQDTLVAQG